MALTVGTYAWPSHAHEVGVAAVIAMTVGVNYFRGEELRAWVTRLIVAVVLAVLAAVVASVVVSGETSSGRLIISPTVSFAGVLQAAGLLFFAFAGYARIATLGEEVRDPARTIPRAIPLALGVTLGTYATVAVAALAALGPERLAESIPSSDRRRSGERSNVDGADSRRGCGGGRAGVAAGGDPWPSRELHWLWLATGIFRMFQRRFTRAMKCHTGSNSPSVLRWQSLRRSPTFEALSASRRSPSWRTTP